MHDAEEAAITPAIRLRLRHSLMVASDAERKLRSEEARHQHERTVFGKIQVEQQQALERARAEAAGAALARERAEAEHTRLVAELAQVRAQLAELQRSRWRRWGRRLGLAKKASFE